MTSNRKNTDHSTGLPVQQVGASPSESDDAPRSKTVAPLIFSPDKKVAKRDFAEMKADAAWFCAQSKEGHRSTAMLAVTIKADREYTIEGGGRQILRRGGALMQRPDKGVVALQPEAFIPVYVRCFSDGTEICRLRDPEMQQAVALSQSNTQIRTRLEQIRPPGFWAGVWQVFGRSGPAKQIKEWNMQLRSHIQDLAARHKLRAS